MIVDDDCSLATVWSRTNAKMVMAATAMGFATLFQTRSFGMNRSTFFGGDQK
jgi:hypothetical protein